MSQLPDTKPGHYYVSAVDGGRYSLLSGPYSSHSAALADVDMCRRIAMDLDPKGCFYSYGTCRWNGKGDPPDGVLQKLGRVGKPGA